MTTKRTLFGVAGLAVLACALAGAGFAEDPAQNPQNPSSDQPADAAGAAPAEAAPANETAAAPAAEAPPAAPVKPRPAELMPRAAESLMLGIVDTGEHLIAVGDRGEILVSNDGKNWAQVPVPVRAPLTAVAFADAKNGWAVGHDATIVHTVDGGRTWTLQNFQPELEKPFLGVLFLDASHGFAVGAYGLFDETRDGGASWTEVKADAVRGDELHIYSISKLGNGDLLVAGEQSLLGLSADGGQTWKKLASPYEGTWFGSVPVGDRGALLCGLRGHAYLSQDAAAGKWQQIDTGTTASLFGCGPAGENQALMVGLNGLVMRVDTQTGKVARGGRALEGALSAGLLLKSGAGESAVIAGELGLMSTAAPEQ